VRGVAAAVGGARADEGVGGAGAAAGSSSKDASGDAARSSSDARPATRA